MTVLYVALKYFSEIFQKRYQKNVRYISEIGLSLARHASFVDISVTLLKLVMCR